MDFAEININAKALFDRYLNIYNPQISELTFTNLFMWRKYYKLRYTEVDGLLCIISVPDNGLPYALKPVGEVTGGNFEKAISGLKKYFLENGWRLVFKKVAEDELVYFKDFVSSDESIVFDRDNSDYVYLTEDLISLRGKKFHGKKNHINRFKRQYDFEYVRLDTGLVDECSRIMEEWCKEKDCCCQRGDYCERYANMELLNNYTALGCKGALIKVDGSFEAFTAGEMLNGDTAVIHIEKANSRIDGLYALVNQQFCENEWRDTTYVNREQDLGIEGLRKAKLSYNPVKMINKYIVNVS